MDLTNTEALGLYERWLEPTTTLVFKAAAVARGRADRHHSDLADLYRDLGAVTTADLLLPPPVELPGTPAYGAAFARTRLDEAEQLHAHGAHRNALAYLQHAYCAAGNAIKQARLDPSEDDAMPDGPTGGSLAAMTDSVNLLAPAWCSALEAILRDLECPAAEATAFYEEGSWMTGPGGPDTGEGSAPGGPAIPGPRR